MNIILQHTLTRDTGTGLPIELLIIMVVSCISLIICREYRNKSFKQL